MSQTDRALIVVHRVDQWVRRGYRVSIDGRRIGSVGPGRSAEFPVDPGAHTVEVGIDWVRSRPLSIEVAPGSRTDLRVEARPWTFLQSLAPVIIAVTVANLLFDLIRQANSWAALGLWGLLSRLLITLALIVAAILIPPLLIKDYWVRLDLEPTGGPVSESPAPTTA